jgi:hypothetical protein
MFRPWAVAIGGKMNPSGGISPLQKELWLDGCL